MRSDYNNSWANARDIRFRRGRQIIPPILHYRHGAASSIQSLFHHPHGKEVPHAVRPPPRPIHLLHARDHQCCPVFRADYLHAQDTG